MSKLPDEIWVYETGVRSWGTKKNPFFESVKYVRVDDDDEETDQEE